MTQLVIEIHNEGQPPSRFEVSTHQAPNMVQAMVLDFLGQMVTMPGVAKVVSEPTIGGARPIDLPSHGSASGLAGYTTELHQLSAVEREPTVVIIR